jgi:DnaJ-class molecular chaperone
MRAPTHYETLRVTRDAPDDVIRAVYRAMAQKYHPDRNIGNSEAYAVMQLINGAYRELSNPQRRKEYDASIAELFVKDADKDKKPEQKLDPATEEALKWKAWSEKTAKEAKDARKKADEAAARSNTAPASDKAKWKALAEQTAAAAAEAEKAAFKAAADAKTAAAKAPPLPKQMKRTKTHYALLKVTSNAPIEAIDAAYKALIKPLEPAEGAKQDPAAAEQLHTLAESYAVLSNTQKRAEYDDWVRQRQKKPEKPAAKREPTARELETRAMWEKASTFVKAQTMVSETAAATAKEARKKSDEAAKTAKANKGKKDQAQWDAYAEKLAAEAAEAERRAKKAADDLAAAKKTADAASMARDIAQKMAADDTAAAAREREIWAQQDKVDREKST